MAEGTCRARKTRCGVCTESSRGLARSRTLPHVPCFLRFQPTIALNNGTDKGSRTAVPLRGYGLIGSFVVPFDSWVSTAYNSSRAASQYSGCGAAGPFFVPLDAWVSPAYEYFTTSRSDSGNAFIRPLVISFSPQ